MTRALEIATLAIRCCVVLLLLTTALLFIQLRKSAIIVHEQVEGVGQDIHLVREHADRVLTEAGLTTKAARQFSEMQVKQFPQTMARANKAIEHLGYLIVDTNLSLNSPQSGVLPALARDADGLRETTVEATQALQRLSSEATPVLREAAEAMRGVNRLANDPDIPRIIANMEASSESSMEVLGNLNAMSADGREAFHRITRPTALWKSLLLKSIGIGSQARTLVLGVK